MIYEQPTGIIAYEDCGKRTVNERNGQFNMTLPKAVMEKMNYENHDKILVLVNQSNGDIVLRRIPKLITE